MRKGVRDAKNWYGFQLGLVNKLVVGEERIELVSGSWNEGEVCRKGEDLFRG